ncbi:multidrug efflux RND transporter permease subunit [Chelatococcus sambhunathii]|uniref:Multidrug efflux RND transporter permease subunit n=1 Tax=Chelatococcus sambhunathii TaxID=363953 RepID=A0ABU1DI01_9HYPH|nr:multidrug efflux RND transporter permease subunit [Chelatococcus sambhunathii]MDR4307740.1 multidrug efflux RND transporter permease subunit [Chelatococcus sambhunathii]
MTPDGPAAHSGGVSGPFIRRPVATWLAMAAILLIGLAAFMRLPVAPLPQIDFPTIQVTATLPGASPETMAASVAQPLEREFAQIPGVNELTSVSAVGATTITVEFDLDRDIDAAAQDIQAAINSAAGDLPANLPAPPTYRKTNPADAPILLLSARSDTIPIVEVNDLVDSRLAQQISQIKGVGQVTMGGEQKPAIRVQIDPAKIASKNLTLEDIRGVMATVTSDSPKGAIDGTKRQLTIYADGQLAEADRWNDVVLAYRDGAPIRVRDVGRAVSGPEDRSQAAWVGGKRGLFLVVRKQPGANVVDTVDAIKAELPRLTASLPPELKVEILSDRTTTIRASLHEVELTLVITIALVVAVIFVFLRSWQATVIASLAVPISLLGACALMYAFGYSLNNLSLMALVIAVGFVVDDAIVVIENISRHIEEGMKPYAAALRGAGEIGFTIVSISVSLVAAFIPLLLMGGIIGRLFREFAMTVAITIAVSAVVSLTLAPMLSARLLRDETHRGHGALYRGVEAAFNGMLNAYGRGLNVVLRHQFLTLLAFFATVAASVWLFVTIPKGFFPQQDTGLITGASEAAQDVSFDEMARRQQALDAVVNADPAVETNASLIGAGGGAAAPNAGRNFIQLKPQHERNASAEEVIARLRPKLAEVEGATLLLQSAQDVRLGGRRTRTQFQYVLQDANFETLKEFAPRALEALKGLKELRDVASDQQDSGATLTLKIDRDQASRYGVQPKVIEDTLYDAFGQRQVAQFSTQVNTYKVILEAPRAERGDVETLRRLYVRAGNGEQVPLSALATWSREETAPLTINHQGMFPAVTLSFNLAPGVALGQATAAIQETMRGLGAPASLVGSFAGTAQAFQASISTVPLLILAALVAVYIILGVLYESFVHPLTILSTLPSAGVGALGILHLAGYEFSLIALIGVVLLIGIVKKNGIMLVDFALVAERTEHLTPEEAIRKACMLRFRPILMTTMAAMLGGVPLMLGTGVGFELRQPLGYAMVGGLLVSQLLTLFTTPVVYLYLDRLESWARRGHDAREAGRTEGDAQPAE